jgi:3-phosphoshikimate 1-carboxyvinyltransferase
MTGHGPIVSFCDDTDILAKALASNGDHIDVGAAGTAMRFLTAFFACQDNRTVVLDGTERMRRRPIGLLVDALRQMGASIEYLGDEGCPPLKIEGHRLHGGTLTMRGDVSSQFVSAVLMIAPLAGGITLTLEGDIVSRPYIDMTLAMMRRYGIEAQWCGNQIVVPAAHYLPSSNYYIEGDWSAASYWFALKALLPESRIVLSPLFEDSLQGDRAIVEMMAPLGVECAFADDSVVLASNGGASSPSKIEGAGGSMTEAQGVYERDMAATPDLVPTLAVTLCLLRVPYVLTGVATLRIKESDRLAALREELAKLGYVVEVGADSLSYNGNRTETAGEVTLSPHGDHRMAMALSLSATRHNIVIKDAEVVSKSYPNWWQQLINA